MVEHTLHTGGVTGSIPVVRTNFCYLAANVPRVFLLALLFSAPPVLWAGQSIPLFVTWAPGPACRSELTINHGQVLGAVFRPGAALAPFIKQNTRLIALTAREQVDAALRLNLRPVTELQVRGNDSSVILRLDQPISLTVEADDLERMLGTSPPVGYIHLVSRNEKKKLFEPGRILKIGKRDFIFIRFLPVQHSDRQRCLMARLRGPLKLKQLTREFVTFEIDAEGQIIAKGRFPALPDHVADCSMRTIGEFIELVHLRNFENLKREPADYFRD